MTSIYAIKHKKSKRWFAYKLTDKQLATLHLEYEYKGPFTSIFKAMVAVNSK